MHDHFTLLYQNYRQKVLDDATRITGSGWVAEDITQEVFIKVWISMSKQVVIDDIMNYLFIITRNCCISFLRRHQSEQAVRSSYNTCFRQIYSSTGDQVQDKEYQRLVNQAIGKLPVRQKQAFILYRELGLKQKEVARRMSIADSTAHNHIQQATQYLRTCIEHS